MPVFTFYNIEETIFMEENGILYLFIQETEAYHKLESYLIRSNDECIHIHVIDNKFRYIFYDCIQFQSNKYLWFEDSFDYYLMFFYKNKQIKSLRKEKIQNILKYERYTS